MSDNGARMIVRLPPIPASLVKSGLKLQYHNNNNRLVLGTVPFKFRRRVNSIRRDEVLSSVTRRDHPVHAPAQIRRANLTLPNCAKRLRDRLRHIMHLHT